MTKSFPAYFHTVDSTPKCNTSVAFWCGICINMYQLIVQHDNPNSLLSDLADTLIPLKSNDVKHRGVKQSDLGVTDNDSVHKYYLHFLINMVSTYNDDKG